MSTIVNNSVTYGYATSATNQPPSSANPGYVTTTQGAQPQQSYNAMIPRNNMTTQNNPVAQNMREQNNMTTQNNPVAQNMREQNNMTTQNMGEQNNHFQVAQNNSIMATQNNAPAVWTQSRDVTVQNANLQNNPVMLAQNKTENGTISYDPSVPQPPNQLSSVAQNNLRMVPQSVPAMPTGNAPVALQTNYANTAEYNDRERSQNMTTHMTSHTHVTNAPQNHTTMSTNMNGSTTAQNNSGTRQSNAALVKQNMAPATVPKEGATQMQKNSGTSTLYAAKTQTAIQQNSVMVAQKNSSGVARNNAPIVPQNNAPIVQQYNAPMVPQYNAPIVQQYNAPMVPQYNTPIVPQYNAPVVAPKNLPTVAYNSFIAQQNSVVTVSQKNTTLPGNYYDVAAAQNLTSHNYNGLAPQNNSSAGSQNHDVTARQHTTATNNDSALVQQLPETYSVNNGTTTTTTTQNTGAVGSGIMESQNNTAIEIQNNGVMVSQHDGSIITQYYDVPAIMNVSYPNYNGAATSNYVPMQPPGNAANTSQFYDVPVTQREQIPSSGTATMHNNGAVIPQDSCTGQYYAIPTSQNMVTLTHGAESSTNNYVTMVKNYEPTETLSHAAMATSNNGNSDELYYNIASVQDVAPAVTQSYASEYGQGNAAVPVQYYEVASTQHMGSQDGMIYAMPNDPSMTVQYSAPMGTYDSVTSMAQDNNTIGTQYYDAAGTNHTLTQNYSAPTMQGIPTSALQYNDPNAVQYYTVDTSQNLMYQQHSDNTTQNYVSMVAQDNANINNTEMLQGNSSTEYQNNPATYTQYYTYDPATATNTVTLNNDTNNNDMSYNIALVNQDYASALAYDTFTKPTGSDGSQTMQYYEVIPTPNGLTQNDMATQNITGQNALLQNSSVTAMPASSDAAELVDVNTAYGAHYATSSAISTKNDNAPSSQKVLAPTDQRNEIVNNEKLEASKTQMSGTVISTNIQHDKSKVKDKNEGKKQCDAQNKGKSNEGKHNKDLGQVKSDVEIAQDGVTLNAALKPADSAKVAQVKKDDKLEDEVKHEGETNNKTEVNTAEKVEIKKANKKVVKAKDDGGKKATVDNVKDCRTDKNDKKNKLDIEKNTSHETDKKSEKNQNESKKMVESDQVEKTVNDGSGMENVELNHEGLNKGSVKNTSDVTDAVCKSAKHVGENEDKGKNTENSTDSAHDKDKKKESGKDKTTGKGKNSGTEKVAGKNKASGKIKDGENKDDGKVTEDVTSKDGDKTQSSETNGVGELNKKCEKNKNNKNDKVNGENQLGKKEKNDGKEKKDGKVMNGQNDKDEGKSKTGGKEKASEKNKDGGINKTGGKDQSSEQNGEKNKTGGKEKKSEIQRDSAKTKVVGKTDKADNSKLTASVTAEVKDGQSSGERVSETPHTGPAAAAAAAIPAATIGTVAAITLATPTTAASTATAVAATVSAAAAATAAAATASAAAAATAAVMGPDEIAESTSLWATRRDQAVQLRTGCDGPLATRPISVISAFQETVSKYPNHLALASKCEGAWSTMTYRMYYDTVWQAAKAFIHLGLQPYHGVGILGFNSPEWFISNFAAIFAGGLSTGIYSTNSAEACCFVAKSAKCDVIVVEDETQLQKILKVRSQLPDLKAVVLYRGKLLEKHPQVYTWSDFLSLSSAVDDEEIKKRISQQSVNKCCSLIYTSGTTGNPKGVMLSHDNLIWTARMAGQTVGLNVGAETLVSYLPLSHIAAQILDMYIPLLHAASVFFAQPDALKGTLVETLKDVRPTAFLGVPRVWEKMQEKMEAGTNKAGIFKKLIMRWARDVGQTGNLSRMNGGGLPVTWGLANVLVFKKIRNALGMDRCRICMTAAAPIQIEALMFFASIDLPLMEIYGMSETSGPHTINTPSQWKLGSIGAAMKGASVELVPNPLQKEGGEVCMSGRNIFMGYLDEEEKTKETLDSRGFIHSGDLGKVDERGFYYITGRIKELLITAGGENVAPVPIEDAVKVALPCVSNCMLVGDKKKFLAVLLTLKTETDPVKNEPLDLLTESAMDWFRDHDGDVRTVLEVLNKPSESIMHAIQAGIDEANLKAVSRAQIIQKFSILPRDFSIAGGELGPTLKLKRPIVLDMYKATIDAFYADQQ